MTQTAVLDLALDGSLFIGGKRRDAEGGNRFGDVSPVTGVAFASLAAAEVPDGIAAVEAAAAAAAIWSGRSFVERRRILLDAADILESELDSTEQLFALEIGGVSAWAAMNVREAAATLREAAGLASSPLGEILPSHDALTVNLSIRQPAGVVLAIVPWNAPLVLAARSTAIALALGNTVVLRPSEEAPFTAGHLLASALDRAGLPAGVMNVVTTAPGMGRTVIKAMIEHPAVQRVVFIGSTAVGRSIASVAGAALTPAVMELGGKNATIVRADVDLDRWIPQIAFASFVNAGQVCMCTEQIIAHREIADELTERLADFAERMTVGDPRTGADLGPVINARAAGHYAELVDDARANGAPVLAGGTADGLYLRPTVVGDLSVACRFYREEAFVPIVGVIPVDNDDQAVAVANSGEYGLIASVLSNDGAAAEELAGRLNSGAVHINGPSVGDEPHVPFGGIQGSGFGRLGGAESVHFFTAQRTLYRHPR